jgi:hypothetical protein
VTIRNTATGVARTLTTNSSGFYSVPNLLPGSYEVTTSAHGFAPVVEKLELKVGAEAVVNVQLEVGEIADTVLVEGGTPAVDQGTSMLSAAVEGKTIRELPLNGRDWTQLATLEPGVSTITTQTPTVLGNAGRANRGWGTQLTVGGARPQQNNYRVDGISINDYSGGGSGGPGLYSGSSAAPCAYPRAIACVRAPQSTGHRRVEGLIPEGLLQLLELLPHHCHRQGQVDAAAGNGLLAFPAQDVAQELLDPGIHRLAGRAVDEEVHAARQRVRPVLEALLARLDVGPAGLGGQRDGLDPREALDLPGAGEGDSVLVLRELGEHPVDGERLVTHLLGVRLDVLAEVGVPFLPASEHLLLEEDGHARQG